MFSFFSNLKYKKKKRRRDKQKRVKSLQLKKKKILFSQYIYDFYQIVNIESNIYLIKMSNYIIRVFPQRQVCFNSSLSNVDCDACFLFEVTVNQTRYQLFIGRQMKGNFQAYFAPDRTPHCSIKPFLIIRSLFATFSYQ